MRSFLQRFSLFSKTRYSFPCFSGIEKILLGIILALYAIVMGTVAVKHIPIDSPRYFEIILTSVGLLALGQFYRCIRTEEKIALPCTVLGLFCLYTAYASAFNHLLIPTGTPRIDPFLIYLDQLLGFNWIAFTTFFVDYPMIFAMLGHIYGSILPQMAFLLILLGAYRQDRNIVMFLTVGILGSLLTIGFWYFFPSSGPASFLLQTEAAAILKNAPLITDTAYGIRMNTLFEHGIDTLSPRQALGLISFPSFHTVMALMMTVFIRPIKPAFYVILLINILMIPAILIHGAHYLVDVIGGILTFMGTFWIANTLINRFSPELKNHPHSF